MKPLDNTKLVHVGGQYMVIPIGADPKLAGILIINRTAAELFERFKDGADRPALEAWLRAEYDLSQEEAADGVEEFFAVLRDPGLLVEE